MFFISLLCYVQPDVFVGKSITNSIIDITKYRNSGLTDSLKQELKESLILQLKEKKVYLNQDLILIKLSDLVGSDRYSISQIINQEFGKNYYEFVNDYRIEEAIQILTTKPDYTISDVIYLSGFNNRVSFNKAFKKRTGKTPSDYVAHIL